MATTTCPLDEFQTAVLLITMLTVALSPCSCRRNSPASPRSADSMGRDLVKFRTCYAMTATGLREGCLWWHSMDGGNHGHATSYGSCWLIMRRERKKQRWHDPLYERQKVVIRGSHMLLASRANVNARTTAAIHRFTLLPPEGARRDSTAAGQCADVMQRRRRFDAAALAVAAAIRTSLTPPPARGIDLIAAQPHDVCSDWRGRSVSAKMRCSGETPTWTVRYSQYSRSCVGLEDGAVLHPDATNG